MESLSLYLVTWNVATRNPTQDLNSLLDFPSQYNKNKALPDFYIIGLQEVKSQPQNILLDSLFTDPWTTAVNKILCRQGYVTVKTIRLQGLILVVYSQLKHITHLRDIEAQYTKTGLGGVWGNKGAISVRFNIYGCSVCLVNCHLTAHEHLLADRVQDYNTIVKSHTYHIHETSNIMFHDYVFWIGDLNFRTDHPTGNAPTSEEIVAALDRVEKDKYTNLLTHDQLNAVMQSGDAFSEFKEAEIRFPPTYKFNIGTDTYDLKRKPSWTDRVLYKVIPNNYENVTLRADCVSYNHLPHYTLSDHKPVVAQYTMKTGPCDHGFGCLCNNQLRPNNFGYQETPQPIRPRRTIGFRSAVAQTIELEETRSDVDTVHDGENSFSNYHEKTVEFANINNIWYIGDADFRTQLTLSRDVEVNPNDWIGIYDANFQSLDDYISYEYLAKVTIPGSTDSPDGSRTITLSFPVGSSVRTPGFFRFMYFSQPNSDVRSVLGISEAFEVSAREEKGITVEPHELVAGPSTSRPHAPQSPAPHSSDSFFTDFAALDVANLSRHFANDLNID